MHSVRRWTVLLAAVALLGTSAGARAGTPASTIRVSVSTGGGQGDLASGTEVSPLGVPSGGAVISNNGRVVAFTSLATNLSIRADTNHAPDVFVRNLTSGKTRRVSVSTAGRQANGVSSVVGISGKGRFILFNSHASNLSARDANHAFDAYLRDTADDKTRLVSVDHQGVRLNGVTLATSISSNGRWVTMTQYNPVTHIETVILRDLLTGRNHRLAHNDFCPSAVVSSNGRYVAYACGEHDPSLAGTILLDRATGKRRLLSVNIAGSGPNQTIATDMSNDGRYVALTIQTLNTAGTNVFSNVYEYDRVAKTYRKVTTDPPFTHHAFARSVSEDGRYVTFVSDSPNLVAGDANGHIDVFRRDLQTNTTALVSLSTTDTQPSDDSQGGSMNGDGALVLFQTADGSMVSGDTNGHRDVFLRRLP
jgi:Tol biopolymer transport system component